jgi:DNA-binding phage protein
MKNMNEKYKNLKITKRDFKVIPGGPYESNYDKEPDHNNLDARLYWYSINEIAKAFIIYANKTKSYEVKTLISLIRIVFNIFKNFTDLPEDLDLKDVLIHYITKSFEDYSNEQFNKINEEIEKDLKNNYNNYYQMLLDNNAAKNKLNQCIEENKIEIYQTLIPDKIKNFMENAILKLRQSIENQFEIEFTNKNKLISSNDYINKYIHEIIEEINKANFQEDINMNIVKNYTSIWNTIEKENEGLFKYFIEKKPTIKKILIN